MRFATFADQGRECLGIVESDEIVDATSLFASMVDLVSAGETGVSQLQAAIGGLPRRRLDAVRLMAPFPKPTKNIMCLGLNYREHAAESAAAQSVQRPDPEHPLWFSKAVTSVCGPYDDIFVDPSISTHFDWEAELLVVIGKPGRRIKPDDALDHVFGYTVFNDFSVRDLQRRGTPAQWFRGKSYDRASPMGPWLVTAGELGSPPEIEVACRVNGETKQKGNSRDMIFSIATAIADISEVVTLEPGDLIATGTPAGVGFARNPPEFLKPGDVLETEIEGIGVLRNRILEESRDDV